VSEGKAFPAWAWVGCGCLGAIGAIAVLAVTIGFWGVQKARQFEEKLADPAERAKSALAVLGASELPEGYHPVVAFSVPLLLDVAVLSDLPPDETGRPAEFGERGFIYVSYPAFGQDQREIRDFFEGTRDDLDELGRHRIDLDLDERISNGKISREADDVLWVSYRGTIDTDDAGRSKEGLMALLLIDCGGSRQRFGVWLGPDPDPEAAAADLDVSGTVSDPEAIERFLSPIHPCH
jgi:hypothetical protein